MFPSQPAARAHQLKRHPILDVGIRDRFADSSPGAGHVHGSGLSNDYKQFDDARNSRSFLITGIPVQTTTITTNLPASGVGGTPTPTTVVQVSTSTVTIVVLEESSFPDSESYSTLPAVTNTADLIPSSSSPSPSPAPPSSSLQSTSTSTPTVPPPNNAAQATTTPPASMSSSVDTVRAGSGGESNKSSGVPGGAIAAAVIIVVLALCALAFFVLRNRRIQKRIARRVTWTAGLAPSANFDTLEKGASHVHPTSSNEPTMASDQSATSQGSARRGTPSPALNIPRKPPLPYSPVSPIPPAQSYNNPPHDAVSYVHSASTPTPVSVSTPNVPMLVRVTFVPQLPDELAITPGETLYIQTEYDDGWALCVNVRGKQGMVPLECLERDDGELTGPSRIGDWRMSRRASSLRSVARWT